MRWSVGTVGHLKKSKASIVASNGVIYIYIYGFDDGHSECSEELKARRMVASKYVYMYTYILLSLIHI